MKYVCFLVFCIFQKILFIFLGFYFSLHFIGPYFFVCFQFLIYIRLLNLHLNEEKNFACIYFIVDSLFKLFISVNVGKVWKPRCVRMVFCSQIQSTYNFQINKEFLVCSNHQSYLRPKRKIRNRAQIRKVLSLACRHIKVVKKNRICSTECLLNCISFETHSKNKCVHKTRTWTKW